MGTRKPRHVLSAGLLGAHLGERCHKAITAGAAAAAPRRMRGERARGDAQWGRRQTAGAGRSWGGLHRGDWRICLHGETLAARRVPVFFRDVRRSVGQGRSSRRHWPTALRGTGLERVGQALPQSHPSLQIAKEVRALQQVGTAQHPFQLEGLCQCPSLHMWIGADAVPNKDGTPQQCARRFLLVAATHRIHAVVAAATSTADLSRYPGLDA